MTKLKVTFQNFANAPNTTAIIRLRLLNLSAQQEILYGTKYGQLRDAASPALENY